MTHLSQGWQSTIPLVNLLRQLPGAPQHSAHVLPKHRGHGFLLVDSMTGASCECVTATIGSGSDSILPVCLPANLLHPAGCPPSLQCSLGCYVSAQEMNTLPPSSAHASSAPPSAGTPGVSPAQEITVYSCTEWSHLFGCINAFIMALVT